MSNRKQLSRASASEKPPRKLRGLSPWWKAENRIERLRELWDQGMTTAKIAAELGTSKGAVTGMCWRLKLDQRTPTGPEPTTIVQRLNALNAKMDEVLRETASALTRRPDRPAQDGGAL